MPHDDALEAAAIRRITWRATPLLLALYVVCFLDRPNVGFAALQLNRDLSFSPAVYGLGAGIFFLGYSLFEVPSNLVLARVGARRWLGRIAITWGLLASAMMFVRTPASFYVMRFLLGIAEAGAFPGIIYYFTLWFPAQQRARALSRFMIGVPISGAIGGVLGGALLALDGRLGLAGWQWLFLLEGVPAVILGLITLRWLTDRPEDATWLPDAERNWLRRKLAAEAAARRDDDRPSLRATLTSPVVWWVSLPYFLMSLAMYALLLWQPTLMKEMAHLSNNGVAAAMTASGIAGAIIMIVFGLMSDRSGERVFHAAATVFISMVACIVAALTGNPIVAVVAIGVASAVGVAFLPIFWCIPPMVLGGSVAAGGIGLINSISNIGGFLGPAALGVIRGNTGDFTTGLLAIAGGCLAAALCTLTLYRALARTTRD
jgi:ACS family tartrate transporter-like MFS transporter